MGKRSNFDRVERDFYPTPYEAVIPLLPYIDGEYFYEPCAGNGALVDHLIKTNRCSGASDIHPMRDDIIKLDALDYVHDRMKTDCIITNPPWDRKILHPMIEHFRLQSPTFLLFDADWMHTKQSAPYMKYCEKIVSVGRIKWVPDSKMTGKDNCAWYKFVSHKTETQFIGR